MKSTLRLILFSATLAMAHAAVPSACAEPRASTTAPPSNYAAADGKGALNGEVYTPPNTNAVPKPNAPVLPPGTGGSPGDPPMGPPPPKDPLGGVGFDPEGHDGHDGIDGKPGGGNGGNGQHVPVFVPDPDNSDSDAQQSNGGGGGAGGHPEDKGGDPVGYTSGAASTSTIDLVVECPGIDLVFQRVYNSSLTTSSGLGLGWTHSYAWELVPYSSGKWMVLRAMADPSQGNTCATFHNFERFEDGTYSVSDAGQYFLTQNADGTYVVKTPGPLMYRFGADGVMESISDMGGTSVTLVYAHRDQPESRRLAHVVHTNGKMLEFDCDSKGLIQSIQAPGGMFRVEYAYTNVVDWSLASATRIYGGETATMSYKYAAFQEQRTPSGFTSRWYKDAAVPDQRMSSVFPSSSDTRTKIGRVIQINAPVVFTSAESSPQEGLMIEKTDPNGITAYFNYTKYTDAAGARTVGTVLDGGLYETSLAYYTGKTVEMRLVAGKNVRSVILYDNATKKEHARQTGSTVTRRRFNIYGDVADILVSDTNTMAYAHWAMNYGTWHNVTNFAYAYCEPPTNFWTQTWNLDWLTPQTITSPEGRTSQTVFEDRKIVNYGAGTNSPLARTVQLYDANWRVQSATNANGRGTTFHYAGQGYLQRIAADGAPEVSFERDALGHLSAVSMPGPGNSTRKTRVENNAFGRPTRVVHPDGSEETFRYDGNWRRVVESVDALGRTTAYEWVLGVPVMASRRSAASTNEVALYSIMHDHQMNTMSISDPLGRVAESYVLDRNERVVAVTNLEGQAMTRSFIVGDRVNHVTRYDGTSVHQWYEENGQPWVVQYPDDQIWYTYDRDGLMLTASNTVGVVGHEYNEAAWLTKTRGVDGAEVSYGYHPAGQVSNIVTVAGATGYALDAADRLSRIAAPSAAFDYAYNPWNGFVSAVTNSSGLVAEFQYDIMDRPTNIVWRAPGGGVLASFRYAYNALGMITGRARSVSTNEVATAYGYDDLDRLASETEASGVVRAYAYDLAGNRLSKTETGSTPITYALGVGDRLATYTGGSYTHNAAGCATSIDRTGKPDLALAWNGQYQLTSVSTNGVVAESYAYDPLGRRASTTAGGVTIRHVYDGIHCVADLDAAGAVVRSYTWGPGIDNLLAVTCHSGSSSTTYYALTDIQGTVHGFADADGNLFETYAYDAWGNVLSVRDANGLPIPNQQSQIQNRFLFQGREYSWATGLYNFRLRWYDPATGRWLSKDPIGISGGLNLYAFCGNDPVNSVDPWGLREEDAISPTTFSFGILGVRGSFPFGGLIDLSAVGDTDGRAGVKLTLGVGWGIEAAVDTFVNDLLDEFAGGVTSVGGSEGTIYDQTKWGAEAHAGILFGSTYDLVDPGFSGYEFGSIGGGAYGTGSVVLPLFDPNWRVVKALRSLFK